MATDQVTVTIVSDGLTNATYASGDCLDNVWTTTGFAQANNGSGAIVGCSLHDDSDGIVGAKDIYVFDSTVSLTDNSPFAPSDTEMKTLVPGGIINLPPPSDTGAQRVCATTGYWPYTCIGSSTSLYFAVVTRGADTAMASAGLITIRFAVLRIS